MDNEQNLALPSAKWLSTPAKINRRRSLHDVASQAENRVAESSKTILPRLSLLSCLTTATLAISQEAQGAPTFLRIRSSWLGRAFSRVQPAMNFGFQRQRHSNERAQQAPLIAAFGSRCTRNRMRLAAHAHTYQGEDSYLPHENIYVVLL
jgi:hypothetical protein